MAIERGPLVHCLESADVGSDVDSVVIDVDRGLEMIDGEVVAVVAEHAADETDWPYSSHSRPAPSTGVARPVRLQPYREWGNRGPGTMRVFIPVA